MELDYRELITKFLAGEISDDELVLLKTWLSQDKDNRRIFDLENELWQESDFHTKLEHFDANSAWKNISAKLQLKGETTNYITILKTKSFKIWIAAASVACLLIFGSMILWITEKPSFKLIANSNTVISTMDGEKSHIVLPDSTEIILNSGSRLEYTGQFNLDSRIVKLKGEAFFNVNTNPEKPFIVQLDQMEIFATGTRFNVFSFENEDRIETTLEEGNINISIIGSELINLKAGQQVIFSKHSKKIDIHGVNTDTYTSWKENKLRFHDTPMEEALRKIARRYNVTFELSNKDLLDIKYTATFIDESIEEVMQMLKVVSPITYKIDYRTSTTDVKYLRPKIVMGYRKTI